MQENIDKKPVDADAGDGGILEANEKILKILCHNCLQKLDVTTLEPFSSFACPACGATIIVPKWFDNYLLEELVGEGRISQVYRALDLTLDREVAIKILNKELAAEASNIDIFLSAARNAANINHFGVVPIYSCGCFEGQAYFVSQYMGRGNLKTLLTVEGPQPPETVITWMIDIAEGLDNARRHGVEHHEVRLENMLLDTYGKAKIGDFSMTWAIERASGAVAAEDGCTDIFDLGVAFYQLLTGHSPEEEFASEQDIPEDLQKIILEMLTEGADDHITYRELIHKLSLISDRMDEDNLTEQRSSFLRSHLRKAILILLLLIAAAATAWFLSLGSSDKSGLMTGDHLPAVTTAFNHGDPLLAGKTAAAALENIKSSNMERKQAALQLIAAYSLSNDRKLRAKCLYISEWLKTADVPQSDMVYRLITFAASLKHTPESLIGTLETSNNEYKALGHFFIFLRYLYYSSSDKLKLEALDKFEQALKRCDNASWVYQSWHQRIPVYRKVIEGKYSDGKLEPLMQFQLENASDDKTSGDKK